MPNRNPIVFSADTQQALVDYINRLFVQQSVAQATITTTTTARGLPQIDLRPEEGWMLMLLARMIGAKRAVEIGTLAGYSASWLAQGLGTDGHLISFELDPRHAEIARQNLTTAGVADRVEIRVGNAHEHLPTLEGEFDLVFIDADKTGYARYLNWALNNVRVGGLIIAHNAFQHGAIVEQTSNENTAAMQHFNQHVADHPRLLSTIIPVGDGLLVAVVQ